MEVVTQNARVRFDSVMVLESVTRVSKTGNPFSSLRFLDEANLLVFDIMQFDQDAVSLCGTLNRGQHVGLEFKCEPARDGGVRLILVLVFDAD